jgi:CheY-like chemotaxis protein/anti-sigma regulatory factor (Ser/Thr protein kinase)
VLGHELRNPLAPIVNALDLMQMRKSGIISREEQVMRRQVDNLARLVDDLMDISKIWRGLLVLDTSKVEIADVVREAMDTTAPLFGARGHELSVCVPAHGLPVDADRARLAQVLAHILTNAAKFTPPGGAIAVEAALHGSRVELSVRDNGSGIDPKLLPRIFDRFVHGRANADAQHGGLGIGLSIARALVDLHGGRVSAQSSGVGQGSKFTIELPLADADEDEQAPPSVNISSVQWRESGRILVVDDNGDAADLLGEALGLAGYDVRVERDSRRALSVAVDFKPHLAILDIGMPELSGYDVAERLQSLIDPPPKLVALSGYGQPQDVHRSKVAGFERHLVKPVEMPGLLALVTSLLRTMPRAGRPD